MTRYLNKTDIVKEDKPTLLCPNGYDGKYSLQYRIAICHGSSGFYLVQANSIDREHSLEHAHEFRCWATERKYV